MALSMNELFRSWLLDAVEEKIRELKDKPLTTKRTIRVKMPNDGEYKIKCNIFGMEKIRDLLLRFSVFNEAGTFPHESRPHVTAYHGKKGALQKHIEAGRVVFTPKMQKGR